MFSTEYLLTTLDASVPSSGQQPSSPYSEQHPSDDGLSTGLPELLSDLRLTENEQSVSEESVPDGGITLPDHSALPDREIMLENELTEENFSKYFLLPSQNQYKFGVKINKGLLERSKTKLLRTCPGEGC